MPVTVNRDGALLVQGLPRSMDRKWVVRRGDGCFVVSTELSSFAPKTAKAFKEVDPAIAFATRVCGLVPIYLGGSPITYTVTQVTGRVTIPSLEQLPREDLTPEGIQLVIPGAERKPTPTQKQLDLFS